MIILYNDFYNYFDFDAHNPNINSETTDSESEDLSENILFDDGSVTVNKSGKYIHCLTIIGQIEGHYSLPANTKSTKYEHIIPRLVSVEENPDISGLLIILNTVGGDIEAGLAMAELISGMKKQTVSLVLGGSHSIGIPLAVSAKKSFIVPTASMTVHPVRMNGLILGVPQTLIYLKKMEDRVIDFITSYFMHNYSSKYSRNRLLNL